MSGEAVYKKRIIWIDLLRTIAIFGVVLDHAVEGICPLNLNHISGLSTSIKCFAFTAFSVGRIGVPLFLMISGYLLLDKKYDSEKSIRFWKNNWLHLLICTEVWWIIYNVFLAMKSGELSIPDFAEELLFLRAVPMNHTWYMPTLLGLYVLIPFVANAFYGNDHRLLRFPVMFFGVYIFGSAFLKTVFLALNIGEVNAQLSTGFSGGQYGIYIILGYLLKKGLLSELSDKTLISAHVFFIIIMVIFMLWCYRNEYRYNTWYDSPFLLLCSLTLFEFVSRKLKIISGFYEILLVFMSRYSFGVYLLHNIFRALLQPFYKSLTNSLTINILLLWLTLLIISYASAWMISKIKIIGNYLLYLK